MTYRFATIVKVWLQKKRVNVLMVYLLFLQEVFFAQL